MWYNRRMDERLIPGRLRRCVNADCGTPLHLEEDIVHIMLVTQSGQGCLGPLCHACGTLWRLEEIADELEQMGAAPDTPVKLLE